MFTIVRNFFLSQFTPVCTFKYFYNITVQPSILDGGKPYTVGQPKGIKESYMFPTNHNLATPLAQFPYVLVNRSLLCHCRLQSGTTHLAKSLASCKDATSFKIVILPSMLCSIIISMPLPCLILVKTPINSCPSNIFLRFSSTCQLPE